MSENNKESKYDRIYQLLYCIAEKSKFMKDLLVEIENSTDEDYRIKCEINFKTYTHDCVSLVRLIQEEAGFFKCFSGIPPEQYGQPPYERKDCLDLPENKQLVDTFASTISEELTAIEKPVRSKTYKIRKDATSAEDLFEIKIENNDPAPIVATPFYPDITEEQWVESIGHFKNQLIRQHEDMKKEYPALDFKLKEIFVDDEVVSFCKGFMCGPVGMFRNKMVEATFVQKYDNIYELRIFLKLQAKTKDVVVYMTYKEDDKYCFRGNFVDKE